MVIRVTGKRGRIGPSLKGRLYSYTSLAGEITASWPKGPGKARTPIQAFNMEMFRQACIALKLMPGAFLDFGRRNAIGTPMLPRDALMAALYGKGPTIYLPGGRIIRPMATRVDMSMVMDNIAWRKFSMLVRYDDLWEGLDPPEEASILGFDPVTGPQWLLASDFGSSKIWQRPVRANLVGHNHNCKGTRVVAVEPILVDRLSILHEIGAGQTFWWSVYRTSPAGVIQEILCDFPSSVPTVGGWQYVEDPVPTPFFIGNSEEYVFCARLPGQAGSFNTPIQRGGLMQMVLPLMPWQGIRAVASSNPVVGDTMTLVTDTQNTSIGFRGQP